MDDRNWNNSFSEADKDLKEFKLKQDQKIIREMAVSIEEEDTKWNLILDTYYGETPVVYFSDSGKWHSVKGKAKGLGAKSMMRYYKPHRPRLQ